MIEVKREFGIIGLGRIGGNLARQAVRKGIRVVGFDRKGAPPDIVDSGLIEIHSLADFSKILEPPRAIFLYIPAGPPVDSILDELASNL